MNLVTRFLAAQRDRLLMRLGCWLVCFSLVLGLMLPQQRAEALVAELTMTAVASVAAAYLGACGLPFITKGMDKDALVSSVQRLIQEFLDTELGGITIQDWLGSVWDLAVIAGKLIMGRPLTEEFVGFAQWVAGKYGAQVGENMVYSDETITSNDGRVFSLATFDSSSKIGSYSDKSFVYSKFCLGTDLYKIAPISNNFETYDVVPFGEFSFCYALRSIYSPPRFICALYPSFAERISILDVTNVFFYRYSESGKDYLGISWIDEEKGGLVAYMDRCVIDISDISIFANSLSVDRAPSMSYIPEGIEAEQGIALDVGAAATMDLDLVLQGVLEDVLTGELTSTMDVAGEAVVDPPAGEITDVDNLGLPALGHALTSRFPFSIPWDFFRAVQLLAAPAKAPYFEVDFMKPLADEVGGWKGDTTVILDFAEYAIIGQVCRWTSTIGFCLMLAGATKRLIWTA